jgi:hypothetical protein
VIGNGRPDQAAAFAAERHVPFRLLTDPDLRAYAAAGLRRSVLSVFTPSVFARSARAMRAGHTQGATQGDPWQHGGAFVIHPDGRVALAQVSAGPGDHVDPQALVDAVSAPRTRGA